MSNLITESRNEATMHLDEMSIQQALETMNEEDQKVPQQIKQILPDLAKVIEVTTKQFQKRWPHYLYGRRHEWKTRRTRCSRMCAYI